MEEHKRLYGTTKIITIEQLQRLFQQLDYVELAVLFGSRALKTETPTSDYDFAVRFDEKSRFDWGAIAELRGCLGERFSLPDKDFDIVDLGRADRALKSGIAAGYCVLKGDERELQRILKENR